jgi:hypothetical protein
MCFSTLYKYFSFTEKVADWNMYQEYLRTLKFLMLFQK